MVWVKGFLETVTHRLALLWAITRFSWQIDTAYFWNNIAGLASTLFYSLTYLVFIRVLLGKINSLAGYSYTEILFLTLMTQIEFYSLAAWSDRNITSFIELVWQGDLDLVLNRPVSSLFLVTFNKISLFSFIFEGLPTLSIWIYLIIKNGDLVFSFPGLYWGILLFLLGEILSHCLFFIVALIAFKVPKASIYGLMFQTRALNAYPFESLPKRLAYVLITVFPILVTSTLSTSFMLGKITDLRLVGIVFILTILFLLLKSYLWKIALRLYTSASS